MGTSEANDAVTVGLEQLEAVVLPGEEVHPGSEGPGGEPVPATPIGPGRPLSIRIRSIYPGPSSHGALLVASSVKNPTLFDASPVAMHYVFKDVGGGRLARPRPDQDGSDVIYYSPALLESSLDIGLRLAFDDFDAERYTGWTTAVAKAAQLPAFAIGASGGAAGIAGARALVYAAEKAVKVTIGWFDDRRVASNDWYATWRLNISEPGLRPARAGWVVFLGDDPNPEVIGRELFTRGQTYRVNPEDGTLRFANRQDRIATPDEPYVVAYVDGTAVPALDAWAGTAVSAAVAERFLGDAEDPVSRVGDLLEIYNDVMMLRAVGEVDENLKQETLSESERAALTARRKALLKNMTDPEIRRILT